MKLFFLTAAQLKLRENSQEFLESKAQLAVSVYGFVPGAEKGAEKRRERQSGSEYPSQAAAGLGPEIGEAPIRFIRSMQAFCATTAS